MRYSIFKVHTALTNTSGENKNALPGRVLNSTSSATSFANRLRRSYAVNGFAVNRFSLAQSALIVAHLYSKVKICAVFATSGILLRRNRVGVSELRIYKLFTSLFSESCQISQPTYIILQNRRGWKYRNYAPIPGRSVPCAPGLRF